jgi:hypothetical protein
MVQAIALRREHTLTERALPATHGDLLDCIGAFVFDESEAALPFTARLARENRWPKAYAARAIEEYRRFMYLAVVAGHPVTPSDQVDQVWHLHLLYTRSYWDAFCGGVLGRPIHHGPTRGGRQEGVKFHAWYERTLESYARIFGEPPPADIWPESAIRFGADLHHVRVNAARNWIIPKPRLLPRWCQGIAALLLVRPKC